MTESRSIKIEEVQISDFIPTKLTEEGKYKFSYTIPKFQRDFIWEYRDLKDFWDSIYRNYPVGSFMIWESEEELPDNRQIAENIFLVKNEGNNFRYILDGQQRITSLIVSVLKGKKVKPGRKRPTDLTLYFSLKNAKLESEETDFDKKKNIKLFFTNNDIKKWQDQEKKYLIEVGKLIFFDSEIYSKFYDQGEKEIAKAYQEIHHRINNRFKLSVIILKNIPKEEVSELFTRVNTSGKKLSTIDLITAYTFRDDFYLKGENYLEKLFGNGGDLDILNYNDLDEILFIRLISMINKESCKESDLFELKAKDFKEKWTSASDALIESIQFLKSLNITSPTILPYSPMIVSLSYFFYLMRNKKATFSEEIKSAITKWFWIKSLNGDYQGATNEEIKKDCLLFKNLIESGGAFSFTLSKKLETVNLIEEKLNLSNGFCKTLLCIMANNNPKDFTNHKEINIYDVLVEYKKSELHHIFPQKSEIGKQQSEDEINSIVNICFLPKSSNGSIGKDNPKDYFEHKVKQKNHHYVEDLKSNLIPYDETSGIWDDNFKKFLSERSLIIIDKIKEKIS